MRSLGRNRRSKVSRPIVISAAVACLLIVIELASPTFFPSIFMTVFSPLWPSARGSDAQIEQLSQQLDLYKAEASSSAALATENAELKALMGRSTAHDDILASVVKRPPGAPYDFLILDVGSADGVATGDPVYAAGPILIGTIAEVEARASKAELFSSSGQSYSILIGSGRIPATAEGQGGGMFAASVSREAGVSQGDSVVIPDISSSLFGTVGAVISSPEQPFATVLFQGPFDPYQSRWVLVRKHVIQNPVQTAATGTAPASRH